MAPGGVEPPEACGLLSAPAFAWSVKDGEIIAFINTLGFYASKLAAAENCDSPGLQNIRLVSLSSRLLVFHHSVFSSSCIP